VILVIRRDYNGLRRYAHFGTGNYHSGTARLYGDLGLLTCDPELTEDVGELFNYLTTGFVAKRRYHKLLTSPRRIKAALLYKIKREIALHSAEQPGIIQFKMNALEDADITKALYQAAQAGVQVDLLIRDTCRLRPGIPGLSEDVRVLSIVGRFLEHARIYHFGGGGSPEYYIGSADCMTRNLESRVETLAPVEDPLLQQELQQIIDVQFDDYRSGWEMQPDGSYVQRRPEGRGETAAKGSQLVLIDLARQRLAAGLSRKRKPGLRYAHTRNPTRD
jgi:polyphosphate kinase